jgi:hypothetical protein
MLKLNTDIIAELRQLKGQPVIFPIAEFVKDRIQNDYFEHIKALASLSKTITVHKAEEMQPVKKRGRRRRKGKGAEGDAETDKKTVVLSEETKKRIADIIVHFTLIFLFVFVRHSASFSLLLKGGILTVPFFSMCAD